MNYNQGSEAAKWTGLCPVLGLGPFRGPSPKPRSERSERPNPGRKFGGPRPGNRPEQKRGIGALKGPDPERPAGRKLCLRNVYEKISDLKRRESPPSGAFPLIVAVPTAQQVPGPKGPGTEMRSIEGRGIGGPLALRPNPAEGARRAPPQRYCARRVRRPPP